MRLALGTVALLVALAPLAVAQDSRLSVDPFLTLAVPTAIYDKTTTYPDGTSSERLSLATAPVFGVRLGYRLGSAWAVSVEGAYGTTNYRYHSVDAFQSTAGPYGSETSQTGSGDLTSLAITVTRQVLELANGVRLDALTLGGVNRFGVDRDPSVCLPPSAGGSVCSSAQRWQRRYDAPSVGVGFAMSWSVSPRIGMRVRSAYSLGRADTKAGFWTQNLPQYTQYEADQSHLVQLFQLSAGVGIGL